MNEMREVKVKRLNKQPFFILRRLPFDRMSASDPIGLSVSRARGTTPCLGRSTRAGAASYNHRRETPSDED